MILRDDFSMDSDFPEEIDDEIFIVDGDEIEADESHAVSEAAGDDWSYLDEDN